MTETMSCADVTELAPELALGIAAGEERGVAMEHLARCSSCRKLVLDLSMLGDSLLELAPDVEPPIGFESSVIGKLGVRKRPWTSRIALAGAAAALIAAVSAGAVLWATSNDRRLGERYRTALAVADGKYFVVQPLAAASGSEAGYVFAYEGDPSWIYVVLDDEAPGTYDAEIVTRDGRSVPMRTIELASDQLGWGAIIPEPVSAIARIRMQGDDTSGSFEARFSRD